MAMQEAYQGFDWLAASSGCTTALHRSLLLKTLPRNIGHAPRANGLWRAPTWSSQIPPLPCDALEGSVQILSACPGSERGGVCGRYVRFTC